ncbi:glutathione S-transferase [Rhizobium laguerreae]|uniref:glutathione S-transferase N-terminal domain-containing protein n=1 Tax=Rhizobium laguerreae TaxID=1076926 RepID=UPI00143F541E|nr:glutathione S-transferase N-terminal domain-containing protein [Rhizobium laguerreae]MBY3069431.1 glutathione S-transferase [Rhizobium laguerreae]MBY3089665.1 glutathione S-transferase [Rhizobium laguerreae]MBY3099687.1 glutathione S-transferase [Rhizobium laguerreae]MBY3104253.1 glutathione S-transferase [Rhizobium laguerreae]MBY3124383.1 glutathione S-transferase [Rhizobium laguerreae]
MKLYFAPGFTSLADHIAMLEAGIQFDLVKVDLETKQLEGGGRYMDINPTGYVPALMFDDGEVLTENVAILAWIADRAPELAPQGHLCRVRLLEMLSFIATEIHKRFPTYLSLPEEVREPTGQQIVHWFGFVAGRLERGYLFGETFTVADAYLFQLAWGAAQLGFALPEPLGEYIARIEQRPAVQAALHREGLA